MPARTVSYRHTFSAMASPCQLVLDGLPAPQAVRAAAAAEAEVRRLERQYSRYRPDSIVSRINAAAGGEAVTVDAETARLLDFAAELHAQSDGLFDITSGSLRKAWDFKAGREPAAADLAPLLACVGWHRAQWDGASLRLPLPGMEIDFGGIGKEYAADRAAEVLAAHGAHHGFVNLGGDLRVLGPRPDGTPWRFAIQHPRDDDQLCAHIELSQGALATSGDYERFFITEDGRRCCHILDPRTGQPVQHWQAVSVVAPVCLAAGALATMAMLIGEDAPQRLCMPGVGFLMVGPTGDLRSHDLDPFLQIPNPS